MPANPALAAYMANLEKELESGISQGKTDDTEKAPEKAVEEPAVQQEVVQAPAQAQMPVQTQQQVRQPQKQPTQQPQEQPTKQPKQPAAPHGKVKLNINSKSPTPPIQQQKAKEVLDDNSYEEDFDFINSTLGNVLSGLEAQVEQAPVANTQTPQPERPVEEHKLSTADLIEKQMAELKAKAAEEDQRQQQELEQAEEDISDEDAAAVMEAFNRRIEGKPVVEMPQETVIDGKPKVYAPVEVEIEEEKPASPMELLEWSETSYADEWLETYQKGLRSKKNNEVAQKIRQGRFRINKEHQIEILPDKRTDGMSSGDLLNQRWM